jgi:ankyrin repeat and LEM domain-containing protein 1
MQIAPIHFVTGFDNLEFAEKVCCLFLKKKANPNLMSEGDGLTPLMIGCIWGREKIVKLLLEYGGDLDLKCHENQTAITYAIQENNYSVIEVIQTFVFEQKIDKKKKDLILKSKILEQNTSVSKREEEFSTPIRNNHLKNAIQSIDEKKYTPNRINWNFDATSPFYVNITHRRHKTSRENSRALESGSSIDYEEELPDVKKNLFELTQKNLADFSKQMSQVIIIDRLAIHKRRSYIKNWQEKIQQIRMADKNLDIDYINYLNSCNDVTLMNDFPTIEVSDESQRDDKRSSTESFITAESDLQRSDNAMKIAPDPSNYFERVEEDYIHSDDESGIVLVEKKIISKSRVDLQAIEETDLDDTKSRSSLSTKVTLPPLDYDTDALRNELANLNGFQPGPITKNTKKLYLKQLVKLKKRPEVEKDLRKFQKSKLPADINKLFNIIHLSHYSLLARASTFYQQRRIPRSQLT